MFDNIGGKIKTMAKVLLWIGIVSSLVGGIVLIAIDDDLIPAGIGAFVGGSLLSWLGSFLIYGFGQLIEDNQALRRKLAPENLSETHASIALSKEEIRETTQAEKVVVENEKDDSEDANNGEGNGGLKKVILIICVLVAVIVLFFIISMFGR